MKTRNPEFKLPCYCKRLQNNNFPKGFGTYIMRAGQLHAVTSDCRSSQSKIHLCNGAVVEGNSYVMHDAVYSPDPAASHHIVPRHEWVSQRHAIAGHARDELPISQLHIELQVHVCHLTGLQHRLPLVRQVRLGRSSGLCIL